MQRPPDAELLGLDLPDALGEVVLDSSTCRWRLPSSSRSARTSPRLSMKNS